MTKGNLSYLPLQFRVMLRGNTQDKEAIVHSLMQEFLKLCSGSKRTDSALVQAIGKCYDYSK